MEAWDEKKWTEIETLFGRKKKRGNNMFQTRDSELGRKRVQHMNKESQVQEGLEAADSQGDVFIFLMCFSLFEIL